VSNKPKLPDAVVAMLDRLGDVPPLSDEGLALRFAALHGQEARWVGTWNAWMVWDGRRWRQDEVQWVPRAIRDMIRAALGEAANTTQAKQIASARVASAVEHLARAGIEHVGTSDMWDQDPWLLNTPGGMVDLRDGRLRPHDPGDFLTRMTRVSPRMGCPGWMKFLDRVTGGDRELQAYLARCAGYSLTGFSNARALLLLWGPGGNGKGTFVEVMQEVMGDYAAVMAVETLMADRSNQHPTDLAKLAGARMVVAEEGQEGQRLNEALVKRITGNDTITARKMRQDFFDFRPQFTPWLVTNHKPQIQNVDQALRDRMHLIPFTVRIPEEEQDKDFRTKLIAAEAPGILYWAISGCLAWQEHGLVRPTIVRAATNEYLAGEDKVGQWLEDCCELHPTYESPSTFLFESWCAWCARGNERPGTQKRFSQRLLSHSSPSFSPGRNSAGKVFRGLRRTQDDVRRCEIDKRSP
jgi:putative DNA primase/helicase